MRRWRAERLPHLCHVSFTPLPSASDKVKSLRFFEDIYPDNTTVNRRKNDDVGPVGAYTLSAETKEGGRHRYVVDPDRQVYTHTFSTQDGRSLRLNVEITDNEPYSTLGPMGLARFLPLPIYWHVFSVRSTARVILSDSVTGETLLETEGLAHQEKNWGERLAVRVDGGTVC